MAQWGNSGQNPRYSSGGINQSSRPRRPGHPGLYSQSQGFHPGYARGQSSSSPSVRDQSPTSGRRPSAPQGPTPHRRSPRIIQGQAFSLHGAQGQSSYSPQSSLGYGQASGHRGQAAYGQQGYGQYGQGRSYNPSAPSAPYPGYASNGPYQQAAPQPPPGVSPELFFWFLSVDEDQSGQITAEELQRALMNGNWSPFNAETCRLMVGMFDQDKNGTIGIHEFSALWKYITDWKACFDSFDRDRSGDIDENELMQAFHRFGYNLGPGFVRTCIRRFDRGGRGSIQFDDFIQCCVMLHTLTNAFRKKDVQQQGRVTLAFEEYLTMILDNSVIVR